MHTSATLLAPPADAAALPQDAPEAWVVFILGGRVLAVAETEAEAVRRALLKIDQAGLAPLSWADVGLGGTDLTPEEEARPAILSWAEGPRHVGACYVAGTDGAFHALFNTGKAFIVSAEADAFQPLFPVAAIAPSPDRASPDAPDAAAREEPAAALTPETGPSPSSAPDDAAARPAPTWLDDLLREDLAFIMEIATGKLPLPALVEALSTSQEELSGAISAGNTAFLETRNRGVIFAPTLLALRDVLVATHALKDAWFRLALSCSPKGNA